MNDLNDELEVELMMPHIEVGIPSQSQISSWTPPRSEVSQPEQLEDSLDVDVDEDDDSDDYETEKDDEVMKETLAAVEADTKRDLNNTAGSAVISIHAEEYVESAAMESIPSPPIIEETEILAQVAAEIQMSEQLLEVDSV